MEKLDNKYWIEIDANQDQSIDELAGKIANIVEVYIEKYMDSV